MTMWSLTLSDIIDATGGRLLYGKPNGVRGISIDSRTIRKGELFVALKGERFDGHDFLPEALGKACGALVSVPPAAPPAGKIIIYVDNTLKALQDIAHRIRQESGIPVVGITGTNGKTTTKEMATSILGTKYRVLKNTGNLNNQIGLPLSLLELDAEAEAAVLEMGASAPGDIRELCGIASPDYGVLTNIGHAHIEGFKDIGAVREAKMELLDSVRVAAVNADDAFLMEGITGFEGKLLRFGMSSACDVYAADIDCGERECTFTLSMGGEHARIRLGVTGLFNIYNALAASSVGAMFSLDIQKVREGLEKFEGVPMRLEIKELGSALVISDVYNANPASMEEALKELLRLRRGRAVAVLGDMLELGSYAEAAHRRLGRWMSRFPVDLFIAVGPLMSMAAEEFIAAGGTALRAEDSAAASRLLRAEYTDQDTILVKGSRSMRMEVVLEDPAEEGASSREGGGRRRRHAL
jgi:UDP-N-acetylmuramoyl-tripeptide--D-alanyl-D-alanine ligase